MALKLSTIADGTIEVIASIDGAIPEGLSKEKFDKYIETLDESLLELIDGEQPTRFILRRVLPWALSQKVANKQMRMDKGEMQPQLSFMTEEVRCSLVGIKNPDSMPEDEKIKFERGSDGGASEDLMARLVAAGIAMELYHARSNATKSKQKSDPKKS